MNNSVQDSRHFRYIPEADTWDLRFLRIAKEIASWSKDPSTQTGAVLTMGRVLISTGFNGFAQQMSDSAELYAVREIKYSRIIHCEMNALIFAKRDLTGATLYTWPFLSCERCVVHMLQAGVERFVAPLSPPELEERWGVKKTRDYILEAGCDYMEIGL